MLVIPLQSVPSQTVNTVLGGQACTINVYQKSTGVYLDLYVSGVLIIGGVLCLNAVKIVRDPYLGFIGDLVFLDNQTVVEDPAYTGLGSRWVLYWLDTADVAAFAAQYEAYLLSLNPIVFVPNELDLATTPGTLLDIGTGQPLAVLAP